MSPTIAAAVAAADAVESAVVVDDRECWTDRRTDRQTDTLNCRCQRRRQATRLLSVLCEFDSVAASFAACGNLLGLGETHSEPSRTFFSFLHIPIPFARLVVVLVIFIQCVSKNRTAKINMTQLQ